MLENVRGFLDSSFEEYREHILDSIQALGYITYIKLLNASDYGVPQLRPRVVIIGIRKDQIGIFTYPDEMPDCTPTVGEILCDLMAQNGWEGAKQWALKADRIAPTLVGVPGRLGLSSEFRDVGLEMKRRHMILKECPDSQVVC